MTIQTNRGAEEKTEKSPEMHTAVIKVCVEIREISPGLFFATSPMVRGVNAHGKTEIETLDNFEVAAREIKKIYEMDYARNALKRFGDPHSEPKSDPLE